MKDYSYLNEKTLVIHHTYLRDEGKSDEYTFYKLAASEGAVTAVYAIMGDTIRSCTFEDALIDSLKENTAKKEFEIKGKKFVPDYTVHRTVDQRIGNAPGRPSEDAGIGTG